MFTTTLKSNRVSSIRLYVQNCCYLYVLRIDYVSYLASLCLSQHFSPSEVACANSSSTRFCLRCIHGKTWSHLPENCKHFLSAEASDVPANGFCSCCSSLCYSRPFPPFLLARQKAFSQFINNRGTHPSCIKDRSKLHVRCHWRSPQTPPKILMSRCFLTTIYIPLGPWYIIIFIILQQDKHGGRRDQPTNILLSHC